MNYKQVIEVSGRISEDILKLPCIRGCMKETDDTCVYYTRMSRMKKIYQTEVFGGDKLCECQDGYWIVEPRKKTKR